MDKCILIYNYKDYIKKKYILNIKLNEILCNQLIKTNFLYSYICNNLFVKNNNKYTIIKKNNIIYFYIYTDTFYKNISLLNNINNYPFILKVYIYNEIYIYNFDYNILNTYYYYPNVFHKFINRKNEYDIYYYNQWELIKFNYNDVKLMVNNYLYNNVPIFILRLEPKNYNIIYPNEIYYTLIFNIKINDIYEYKYIKNTNNTIISTYKIENILNDFIKQDKKTYNIYIKNLIKNKYYYLYNNYNSDINIETENNEIINLFNKKIN
jgi:hypothetical protein